MIPETVEGQGSPGMRTLVKNNERYLTIFADLQLAGANAQANIVADTEAELDDVQIDVAGLRGGTRLKLWDRHEFRSGAVALRYRPTRETP